MMREGTPTPELEPKFSTPDATPTPWQEACDRLAEAPTCWLSTVRPDGRPHVTPIAVVWLDERLYFTTGETERKAVNLETNTHCAVTTGNSAFEGLDVVVEGEAVRVTDEQLLRRLADAYVAKYGEMFVFEVRDGAMHSGDSPDPALAFEVRATKAFAFAKGDPFSQTRYRFGRGEGENAG